MLTDEQIAAGAKASITANLWPNKIMIYTIDESLGELSGLYLQLSRRPSWPGD